jgi:hypothetical protein
MRHQVTRHNIEGIVKKKKLFCLSQTRLKFLHFRGKYTKHLYVTSNHDMTLIILLLVYKEILLLNMTTEATPTFASQCERQKLTFRGKSRV